mmetsp:Transcript_11884/g.20190  ORF Transcript_11884/g.20190 Transcript_11884/m.20190 type:complete len:529 (-) Transcript_11884:1030-2616(-)
MVGCSGTSFVRRCLLILACVAYVACAFSNLCHHRVSIARTKNINTQYPHLQLSTRSWSRFLAATSIADTNETSKSAESTFWRTVPTSSSENGTSKLPAIAGIDRETGPLPPGAYKQIGERDTITSCLLGIGIRSQASNDDGNEVWKEASKNCQKLVDAGFNTFIMNNPAADDLKSAKVSTQKTIQRGRGKTEKLMIALEKQRLQNLVLRTKIRHEAEENFYKVLHQNTPKSVLRSCNFMVNLEVPAILSTEQQKNSGVDEEQPTQSFGNGWMVRESVGNALKRVKEESLGSVVLEYCEHSPYHLDVLDSLFEMKREGLIQSISTQNFPPSLLRSALSCGFEIQSNSIVGNLMNTHNLRSDSELGILCSEQELSRHISAPLGGGLFTDSISQSSKKKIEALFGICCRDKSSVVSTSQKWAKYQSIKNTLHELSQKYQVSCESISLRWLLQMNEEAGDSIIVGSRLGMDLREQQGGSPYNRQSDLREVFTFALEDDDMELLGELSGQSSSQDFPPEGDHQIDFSNKALWI